MRRPVTRRYFLKASAITAGAFTAGAFALGKTLGAQPAAPAIGTGAASKVNVAFIGVGGQGGQDLKAISEAGCNVVALCDVDSNSLHNAARNHAGAKTYSDYRKMLESQKDIEAVSVGIPDHHHFPASMMAVKLGKQVYCEKPLTHSIWEARTLTEAARKAKVATQLGTQGHAGEPIRLLTEYIAAGAIGTVKEVHIWTDRPRGWWPQGQRRPERAETPPSSLDWDVWLGPSPQRPFVSKYPDDVAPDSKSRGVYHPFCWRGWWDFGTGALGDIGCHAFDLPFTALKLTAPTSVEAVTTGGTDESGPLFADIAYDFPASPDGSRPALKLFWHDGRNATTPKDSPAYKSVAMLRELAELGPDRTFPDGGQLYIGDKGKLLTSQRNAPRIVPESRMREFKRPDKTIPRSIGHHLEWLNACKGGPPAGANWDYAGPMSEAVLLGNLSVRLGKKILWDSANLRATNAPEAAALIKREYRPGWV